MTFKQLKESIEDRLTTLVHADANNYEGDYISGELHGRLEETKVILGLINSVTEFEIPPLFSVTVDEHGEQVIERFDETRFADPNDPNAGTDSLAAMRARRDEAEPGTDRYDPGRC